MKAIIFLIFCIFLPNVVEAKRVAIFVNGFDDCCAYKIMDSLKDRLNHLSVDYFQTPWNTLSIISGEYSQYDAGVITAGATKNFVDQMNQYFSDLPEGSEVYLFGHSFGGDSIIQFLQQNKRTKIKIRLVALLDPVRFEKLTSQVTFLGLRANGNIPNNVTYFFNRWQRNDLPPTDFKNSGAIQCSATYCDQKEQSKAREVNGNTIYIPCRWFEITCPGYVAEIPFIRKGSLGHKQQRLHHSSFLSNILSDPAAKSITSDDYIIESLIKIIESLILLPPPPIHSQIQLCNISTKDILYTRYAYENEKWMSKGWFSIKASDCETDDFGISKGVAYYYASNADGEWPTEKSSDDINFCASLGKFSILDEEFLNCQKQRNFFVRGAKVEIAPGITTVNILPSHSPHTLTVKTNRTGLGFGKVTSLPVGINCVGTCSVVFEGGVTSGSVTLTAFADNGSDFSGWTGCSQLPKANECQVVMTEDKVVEARFTDSPVMVIERRGTGDGNIITSEGGINCGLDCIEEYKKGNNGIILKPEPANGSVFTGWFGFQANKCPEKGSCAVNVDSFHFLIAQFDAAPADFNLTVGKNGTGSGVVFSSIIGIDCGEDCTEDYKANAKVNLIALPNTDSVFRGWNGECSGKGDCMVTMYNNKNIVATFATANPKIFTVKNLNDSGPDSLRQAILDANANPGDDTVVFQKGLNGTITLNSGQLDITDSVVLDGPGANLLAISGNNASRIFEIEPGTNGTVAINALNFKNGSDISGSGGGAIIIDSGTVTINNSTLSNNSAGLDNGGGGGGAIRKFGPGKLTISNSTVSNNSAFDQSGLQGDGGGIRNDQETLTLINSTVSGNTAASGGGIAFDNGRLVIMNSTITKNSALYGGGGIFTSGGELVLGNSILAGNKASSDTEIQSFGGSTMSQGHNLFGENGESGVAAGVTLTTNDLVLSSAITSAIGPLIDNGGQTKTHLPITGGQANDAGDNNLNLQGVLNDQRGLGFPRIMNGTVDIGAVERTVLHALSVSKAGGVGTISSDPMGIDCGNTCTFKFTENSRITLTATPESSSIFTGWSGDCTGTETCQVNMEQDKNIIANFASKGPIGNKFNLSVNKTGAGLGSIISNPAGISCGAKCSFDFKKGRTIKLTAKAKKQSVFFGWTGDCTGQKTCRLTMDSAHSASATFDLKSYTLSVAKKGNGSVNGNVSGIDCGNTCINTFTSGTQIILTATPEIGSQFVQWKGSCKGKKNTCMVNMLKKNSVTAIFK